jgi:hypothetical protein
MTDALFDKKQILHIATESIVAIGMLFYVNKKNRELSMNIRDLLKRIESQEKIISEQDEKFAMLTESMTILNDTLTQTIITHNQKFKDLEKITNGTKTKSLTPRTKLVPGKSAFRKQSQSTPRLARSKIPVLKPKKETDSEDSSVDFSEKDKDMISFDDVSDLLPSKSTGIDEISSLEETDIEAEIKQELEELTMTEEQLDIKV